MNSMVKKSEKSSKKEKLKINRITSGIEGLDQLIEGGFEEHSVNLIVGTSGVGKTIFALGFLIGGLKKGENSLYVTFEEKKEEFYRNMAEFGWDLEKEEKAGKFTFLEYTPEKVKTMLEEGGGEIESLVRTKKISRIVIDSVTSFALLFDDELMKREAALDLFSIIREWKCTCFLTLQGEPMNSTYRSTSGLEFESDSIIVLYFIMGKKKRERYMEVMKMRGTNHSTELHKVEITKNGVKIDPKATSPEILKEQ
jgi:circadian clock protein KaiC